MAIRTALINRKTEVAEYGVGGGIVADSHAAQEQSEAELKAKVLGTRRPYFDLLETMLWEPGEGYPLMEFHLKRLMQSAEYFGFKVDAREVRERLESYAQLKLRPTGQPSSRGKIAIASECWCRKRARWRSPPRR